MSHERRLSSAEGFHYAVQSRYACFKPFDVVRPKQRRDGNGHTVVVSISLLITMIVLALWILVLRPSPVETTVSIEWSNGKNFEVEVTCFSPDGCLVSQQYNDEDCHHCTELSSCSLLEYQQVGHFQMCYCSIPIGLSILWNAESNVSFASDVMSDMLAADGGVMPMPTKVLRGQAALQHVRTMNDTRAAHGKLEALRQEWFVQMLSEDALLQDSHACQDAAAASFATTEMTKFSMQPWYTVIHVDEVNSLINATGVLGGIGEIAFIVASLLAMFMTRIDRSFEKTAQLAKAQQGKRLSKINRGNSKRNSMPSGSGGTSSAPGTPMVEKKTLSPLPEKQQATVQPESDGAADTATV